MMDVKLMQGDCLDKMRAMPSKSVDSIITDPPYGLGFMGKKWDIGVPAVEVFAECLRILKPGGHLLAFGGSRTYHRLAVAVEDGGFEIRDQIMWVYGSGFPKSRNVGREVPSMDGWGTALKPAHEPIVVARKPLTGTAAANVLEHGTGALNIDGCRIATGDKLGGGAEKAETVCATNHEGWDRPWKHGNEARSSHAERVRANVELAEAQGRWPANLIHDGSQEVVGLFPVTKSGSRKAGEYGVAAGQGRYGEYGKGQMPEISGSAGSAARFFYSAKASKRDRGEGNSHPTVKPTDLMRYLCRLVTPPGGTVLDPFLGSGSTGKAAVMEGFAFIGIELDPGYFEIADRRIAEAMT